MDEPKKIQLLLSENEFLQVQLEDLNRIVQNKDDEISLLADDFESAAYLRSRIDCNLAEIEQLRYNMGLAEQKAAGAEMMNEELELNLLKQSKERQKDRAEIKTLGSVRTELEIISNELDEAVPLYAKLEKLESELAESKSQNDLLQTENNELREQIYELNELIALLKRRKFE